MTIQEAIKSGKPFKRSYWTVWMTVRFSHEFGLPQSLFYVTGQEEEELSGLTHVTAGDILADDWEIKE